MKKRASIALILHLLVLTAAWAGPKSNKLAKSLENLNPADQVDVIIQFVPDARGVSSEKVARATAKGAREKVRLNGTSATALTGLPASALSELVKDPDVLHISPDYTVSATADVSVATTGAFIAQQYGFSGTGIGIAVVDSGINDVPDLRNGRQSKIAYSESFVPGDSFTGDRYGHGTHIAGLLTGNGARSAGNKATLTFLGVAQGAHLINLRVLDATGKGTDSSVIQAIERAIQLKDQYNIRILNLSLGRPVFESYTVDPLNKAVEQAWKAGIFVVVAAGNSGRDNSFDNKGYGTITSPGNNPFAITVGAMRAVGGSAQADDVIATYSSKGPTLIDQIAKPDLVAPGNRVISLVASSNATLYKASPANRIKVKSYQNSADNKDSTDYYRLSGTSISTPMVAGAAALLLEQDRTLTPDQLKARLMKTASKAFPASTVTTADGVTYTSYYDLFTVGAGYLDIPSALANTEKPSGAAESPKVIFNAQTNSASLVYGQSVLWGTTVLWGNSVVWGTSVVSGNSVLWGTSVVWGTASSSAFSVLWGTQSPYANSVMWGQNATSALSLLSEGE